MLSDTMKRKYRFEDAEEGNVRNIMAQVVNKLLQNGRLTVTRANNSGCE